MIQSEKEIKFKCWLATGYMTTPYSMKQLIEQTAFDEGITYLRFTGLKDKNGTDIYEGDILSYPSAHPKHKDKVFNNVVEFASGQSLCGWRMRNKSCVVKATPYKFMISEVIGNVYENPDLLNTTYLNNQSNK